MKHFLLFITSCFFSLAGYCQTIQSSGTGTGDWNDPASWSPATVPTSANSTSVIILDTHTITVTDVQQVDELTVQGGAILNIANSGTLTIVEGAGTDLTVEVADFITTFADGIVNIQVGGTLVNQGQITTPESTFTVNGTYRHDLNGGIIPAVTWSTGSTLELTGITTTVPTGLGQNFYHIDYNSMQIAGALFFNGLATINGNLTITNSNNQFFAISSVTGSTTVNGDVSVLGTSKLYICPTAAYTFNVGGNITTSSALTNGLLLTANGTVTVNLTGNFTKNNAAGTVNLSGGSGVGTIDIKGNVNINAGTFSETGSGSGNLNFTGSTLQTFTNNGTISGTLNFTVGSDAILDLGVTALTGSGTFTANSGSTIQLGSIDPAGALQDNIQVSGAKTFNSGSTIMYNGSAAQFIGTAHPAVPAVVIDNPVSVELVADATMGNLSFTNTGNLIVADNALTLTGTLTANDRNIEVDGTSDIAITGTAAFGTFPFSAGPQTVNNFTFDRTSRTVTFATDVTVDGTLALTNGDLIFNDQVLTLAGTISGTGFLSSNSASQLSITGTGNLGTLTFAVGGNTLSSFILNRTNSGLVSLTGTLTIGNTLTLTAGEFNNAAGTLEMLDGATIIKTADGAFTGNAPEVTAPATYNVSYTGAAQTTGSELPTAVTTDALGDLTINTSAEVTLAHDLTVNGISTLESGSLGIGANILTVKGNWARNSGSLSSYTGFVVFDGNSTISAAGTPPTFGDIQATTGATLTLPGGSINFTENIQIDAGANFDASSGTVILNGTIDQQITSAGADFNNISVNKSSGNVILTTQMNLLGSLSFSTPTIFQSNGNLTVVSSSDGTSGNGRIGSLAVGASVTGDVTVQRYMSGEGRMWRYISSPVQDAVVDDWKDDFPITGDFIGHSTQAQWPGTPGIDETATSLYYYDESVDDTNKQVGYVAYPPAGAQSSNSPLVPGRGYSAYIREAEDATIVDVIGVINDGKTPLDIPVTYQSTGNDDADGWNLIGNPFPSSINWNSSAVTRNGVGQGISITDNASGIFQDWNGESGTLLNGNVATGQAFWVKATSADPSITMGENAKVSTTSTFYRTNENVENQLILSLSDEKITDKAFVVINSESTDSYDPEYDIYNLNNYSNKEVFDIATFDKDSSAMAINYFPGFTCSKTLRIQVKDMKKGDYALSFEGMDTFTEGTGIYLHDNFENSSINISEQAEYNFTVTDSSASYGSDRFYLEFKKDYLASSLNLEYNSTLCSSESGRVEIKNPQTMASYYLLKNNEVISDTLMSSAGETLAFNISADLFNNGDNEFRIASVAAGCAQKFLEQQVLISKTNIDPEIEINEGLLISNYEDGNQWFLNEEIIDGATEQTFRPQESGTYTLNVTKANCIETISLEYIITATDLSDQMGFAVYPNPTKAYLNIQWGGMFLGDKKMDIYNSEGSKIYSTSLGEGNSFKINILSWPRGVYLLKISDSGNILTQRVIKQ